MKYVALLSGGKDSCYNLLHCHQNGHELVVAASLGPEAGKEELDSYMYQTVGQDAIELVAQALDVPLVRRVIRGTAIEQGLEYGAREAKLAQSSLVNEDETEDMYALLSEVKTRYPEVEGVSVGAILSSYQRVRVEHVCRRLSLTPLAYLWQRDQAELLSEMIEAGLEAILIKVAGIGLKESHLGKTLGDMHPTLTKLNAMYGLHVCGEGGEYETLTLDSPMFKRRITLLETEVVTLSEDKYAPVAYLRIKKARLDEKERATDFEVATPGLLEPEFMRLRSAIHDTALSTLEDSSAFNHARSSEDKAQVKRTGPWLALSNISAHGTNGDLSLEDEVAACFHTLEAMLETHELKLSHISNVDIFIANMEDFARINAVYAKFFGSSPPARACVAVDLPGPCRVKLDCIAYAEAAPADRQALHVQGLSYWAPANIGPYSQAINVNNAIFVSGQIGMIPSSLALPSPPSLALETALASQHASRIIGALESGTGGGWKGVPLLNIYWYASVKDAWTVQNCLKPEAPTLHVAVKQLPKNALVEKQVFYCSNRPVQARDDDEEEALPLKLSYTTGSYSDECAEWRWQVSSLGSEGWTCAVVCGKMYGNGTLSWPKTPELELLRRRALSVRLFYTSGFDPQSIHVETVFAEAKPAVALIPSRSLTVGDAQSGFDFALVVMALSMLEVSSASSAHRLSLT